VGRNNSEDAQVFNQHFQSGKFSHSRKVLVDNVTLTQNGALVNFLDPNGANRECTLPALDDGRFYVVGNVGATNSIAVRSANGLLITTLLAGDTALMFASDAEWVALRGWAALGVFTNTVNGLVPAPNSGTPGSLFLRDDGQWGQVQVTGIVDAFKFITDGTNTAIGSGPDTFWIRSSTGEINVTVTNGEAVYGDNVNLTVNEAAVNHNGLLNYVADQHVAHTGVTMTAGLGLTGGGDISATRTFDFAPSELTVNAAPVLTDYAVMDLAAGGPRRTLWSSLNAIFDHNTLVNYSANRHIDHTAVSITASTGLSGGGDISTSRSLALDINGLVLDTPAVADTFAFYDVSGGDHNKATFTTLNGILDHNALLNYVADQHIAHTGVVLTAGAGLLGGGTIAASRTFDVGAGAGITVNVDDVALDTAHVRNVDHSAVSISTTEGLQGGGTIAATRTLKLDINTLTADASPDSAVDYVVTYDASAALHKKVLLTNLPGGLNITGLTTATPVSGDELPFYDVSAVGNRKGTLLALFTAMAGHLPAETSTGTAAVGEVGENATVALSGSLTASGTAVACGNFTLGAGDWDISAVVQIDASTGATTGTDWNSIISTTSTPSVASANSITNVTTHTRLASTADISIQQPHPVHRVSISASTTYYVHANATFSAGTGYAISGRLKARRAR